MIFFKIKYFILLICFNNFIYTNVEINLNNNGKIQSSLQKNVKKISKDLLEKKKKTYILNKHDKIIKNNILIHYFNLSYKDFFFYIYQQNKILLWKLFFLSVEPFSLIILIILIRNLLYFNKNLFQRFDDFVNKESNRTKIDLLSFYENKLILIGIFTLITLIFFKLQLKESYIKKFSSQLKLNESLTVSYINQSSQFVGDNFNIDAKNINYIVTRINKIIITFFNDVCSVFRYYMLFIVLLFFCSNFIYFSLFIIIIMFIGYKKIYNRIIKKLILYKDLIPINEKIYKKLLEFKINFKQLKALGKNDTFFEEISILKKQQKDFMLTVVKNINPVRYFRFWMPFMFNGFFLYILCFFYSNMLPHSLYSQLQYSFTGENNKLKNYKKFLNSCILFILNYYFFITIERKFFYIQKVPKQIIKIESYMKKITIQPMEDKPYVNFKANGNIIITNGNNPRLENINMTIDTNKGNIFGILGESGSGKTSLCNAITGNAPFSNKSISFLGNIDNNKVQIFIEDLHEKDLQSNILLLKQEGLMFEGSIKDNLIFNDKFSDEEMVNILNLVGLGSLLLEKGIEIYLNKINQPINEFNIKQLMENPDPQIKIQLKIKGLQYQCGPFGNRLSGGQRQKLSIARLLLRKPKILVLDEPTTGFDPISSIEFMKNIKLLSDTMKAQGNPITIILITHDLDLVAKFANYIFFMRKNYNNKGEIAEEGDPKQLLINKKSNFALQYFALKDKN